MQWYHELQKSNIVELESSVEKMQISSQKITRLYIEIEKKQNQLELLRMGKLKRKDVKDQFGNPLASPRPPKNYKDISLSASPPKHNSVPANHQENNINNPFQQADNALLRLDTLTAQLFHDLDLEGTGTISYESIPELLTKVHYLLLLLLEEMDIPRADQMNQFAKYVDSSSDGRVSMVQFRYWYTLKYYEVLFRAYKKRMKSLKEPSMEAQQQTLMLSLATEKSLEKQLQDLETKMKQEAASKCIVM